jgi:small subunit ribosomal protein S6
MRLYEILIVTVPEITSDESSSLETQLTKLIEEYKGTIQFLHRWGKYRLAYPVRGNDYGVYFLLRFTTTATDVQELLAALYTFLTVKHNELVMRHLIVKLDPHASVTYHRPESLEETPGKTVDSFIKNKKLEASVIGQEHLHDEDSLVDEL